MPIVASFSRPGCMVRYWYTIWPLGWRMTWNVYDSCDEYRGTVTKDRMKRVPSRNTYARPVPDPGLMSRSSQNGASRFSGAPLFGSGSLLKSVDVLVNDSQPFEHTFTVLNVLP